MSEQSWKGFLVGLLVVAVGGGGALAAERAAETPPGPVVLPKGFFVPGPNTVVKRSSEVQAPPAESEVSVKARRGTRVKAGAPSESCGLTKLETTSGAGKTTLVMTVEKSVETEVSADVKVEAKFVSAGVGFSVTRKYGVSDQTRYEVPKGKFGTIEAYPLYDVYPITIYKSGKKAGGGAVMKPSGVCFNQWTE
ncbi:hypothetical protein [Melittangium boletus]|uniref:Uncharacterized protein n=1 Tax=Melittangium boletus DSM 14713 TaxID=1294270 RepID=A0A250IIC3_9BACT|nr:hypothetical protein [Melittangium boletus]ATB30676.1 hypothetical protein MEBOL_004137 [Melittangium boletus DSM 14713]